MKVLADGVILKRIIVSTLTAFFLVGLWLAASTSYKRAGAFGWKRDLRIIVAILIPINVCINIMPDEVFDEIISPTFWMIVILLSLLHLVLLFKNGNKKKQNENSEKKSNLKRNLIKQILEKKTKIELKAKTQN